MWAVISGVVNWITHKGLVFGFILALLVGLAWARTALVNADALAKTVKTLTEELQERKGVLEAMIARAKELQTSLAVEMKWLADYRQSISRELVRRQEEFTALKKSHLVKVRIPGTEAWKKAKYLELLVENLQAVIAKHVRDDLSRAVESNRWAVVLVPPPTIPKSDGDPESKKPHPKARLSACFCW